MKTITFYSYKGGVGRSLALSNMAIRLSEYNKKVCIIDFDLDAPGLQFKFKNYSLTKSIEKGIVDYIFEYSNKGVIPANIKEYAVTLRPNNKNNEPISFIPAGNIENDEYWKKLAMTNWSHLFYSEQAQGIRFFLDLKAKIETEINPDILLIDSRTGISDISGITLRLFADEAVVLAVNNDENIFGSKRIIKNLLSASTNSFKTTPKVHFVLTRLPHKDTPQDKNERYNLIEKLKRQFNDYLGISDFDISVIHSDSQLEISEKQLIGVFHNEMVTSASNDYLKLFELLMEDFLSEIEIKGFENKKLAEEEFSIALNSLDNAKRLQHINSAIKLDSSQLEYFLHRGRIHKALSNYWDSIKDFKYVLEIDSNNIDAKKNLGYLYYLVNDFETALLYLEELSNDIWSLNYKVQILIKKGMPKVALTYLNNFISKEYDSSGIALNARANLLRYLKDYKQAYSDVYKAIEINPDQSVYFGTLAEIHADNNKIEDFYLNLNVALSKGIKVSELNSAKDVYARFIQEERFINLMRKYEINIDEIMAE